MRCTGRYWLVSLSVLFVLTLPAMAAEWGVLMIDLGTNDVSQGVLLHPCGDGVTEPIAVADEDACVVPKTPPGLATGNHAYFIVDPAVVPDKSEESRLWIAVEYYDEAKGGASSIFMDYDDKGDVYPDQAFALNLPGETRTISFTNTKQWQIAIMEIEQAEFREQGNGGDFRFHILPYMSDALHLNRVWVSNNELTEADLGEIQAVDVSDKLAICWASLKW